MSAQSGPNSGGDLSDMAVEGTTVPSDAAEPRIIPSKPRPDEIASANDPNQLGGTNMAEAATNAGDIPRVWRFFQSIVTYLAKVDLSLPETRRTSKS